MHAVEGAAALRQGKAAVGRELVASSAGEHRGRAPAVQVQARQAQGAEVQRAGAQVQRAGDAGAATGLQHLARTAHARRCERAVEVERPAREVDLPGVAPGGGTRDTACQLQAAIADIDGARVVQVARVPGHAGVVGIERALQDDLRARVVVVAKVGIARAAGAHGDARANGQGGVGQVAAQVAGAGEDQAAGAADAAVAAVVPLGVVGQCDGAVVEGQTVAEVVAGAGQSDVDRQGHVVQGATAHGQRTAVATGQSTAI